MTIKMFLISEGWVGGIPSQMGKGYPLGSSNTDTRELDSFYSVSPRMSEKLKLLHLFGCDQMIIKIFLISVG